MPHTHPGVDIRDSGTPKGRAVVIDFDANLTASVTDGVADVDGSAGGGGGAMATSLDGGALTATTASIDATEGLYATAIVNAVTYSVYGAQSGTLAARPAAARSNKRGLYYGTDVGLIYVSDGSSWTTISIATSAVTGLDASLTTIANNSIAYALALG